MVRWRTLSFPNLHGTLFGPFDETAECEAKQQLIVGARQTFTGHSQQYRLDHQAEPCNAERVAQRWSMVLLIMFVLQREIWTDVAETPSKMHMSQACPYEEQHNLSDMYES